MTSITADLLVRVMGCPRSVAAEWARPLDEACRLYEITTPARVAAFLAQVGHESAGLTRVVENLNYSVDGLLRVWPKRYTLRLAEFHARKPELIANFVYGDRLGNKLPDDGYRYRGRGPMQVTGRANYEAMRDVMRIRAGKVPDFVELPDLLAEPKWGALAAAAYWHSRHLNVLADAGRFTEITRRINGGTNGNEDRLSRYGRAKRALIGVA
ncbi:glycoside hydrolase family 19 protein [Lysobacter korlensis]|uniref:Glycoside hydrolase family 19 protein n=1 Tax=Lysobacter korlensis TaxID=553636 RepID=A0ABV6RKJ2_9GAMM